MYGKNVILTGLLCSIALPALAESNFSGEILFGRAGQTLSSSSFSNHGEDRSYGIRGAFLFSEHLAIEASHQNYGQTDSHIINHLGDVVNDKLTTSAVTLGAKGILPLDNDVSLNARLGLSFWETEIQENQASTANETYKAYFDGSDLYYGIGIQYDVNSVVFIGADYTFSKMRISAEGASPYIELKNMFLSLGIKF